MNSTRTTLYSLLIALSILGMLLVSIVALRYSYNSLSAIESVAGFLVLGAAAGSLWLYRKRTSQRAHSSERNGLLLFGMALGLLWVIEISINNFIAPPLPARDIIDNTFWAVIAASILVASIIHAYKNN
jgi:amino acid transporter